MSEDHFSFSNIRYLEVPLPEDIERMKQRGDFARAQRAIAKRLEKELPLALRKRLLLEQEMLRRLPAHYPYTAQEVLEKIRAAEPEFTAEMLEQLVDENGVEWIYIDGEPRFHSMAASNYIRKVRKGAPDEEPVLDEVLPRIKGQGGMAYHYRIRAELSVSPAAQRPGERIRVDIPLPVACAQLRNIEIHRVYVTDADGRQEEIACNGAVFANAGHMTAYLPGHLKNRAAETCQNTVSQTIATIAPSDTLQRTACIETVYRKDLRFGVEYSFDNVTLYREIDAAQVSDCQPTFYTEELKPHIQFTPFLKELTAEVVGAETNPLEKVRRIYDYITTHIRYSFLRGYALVPDITQYAAAGGKGDCGVQALLFITMCRIAGVPARWQSGQYAAPGDFGSHDWAQFYIAPYGWLFADCSFGGAAYRLGKEDRRTFYFGNLDPFRIPMAAEFQQDFYIPTPHLRNDPYDNQVGEAFYADRALHYKETDMTYTVLEQTEIMDWNACGKSC